jgi:hypothetical protein
LRERASMDSPRQSSMQRTRSADSIVVKTRRLCASAPLAVTAGSSNRWERQRKQECHWHGVDQPPARDILVPENEEVTENQREPASETLADISLACH